ncbi:MAG: hypothetical protein JWR26_4420 [Pedosphaera sp.]|nr:hypothetical protein [Pedosphaera sp.]
MPGNPDGFATVLGTFLRLVTIRYSGLGAELMEAIFELIAQFVCELILQLFAEVLFEFGMQGLAEVFQPKTTREPFLAAVGYGLMGMGAGGLSLLIFPGHFVCKAPLRFLAVILSPIASGVFMSALGSWRKQKGKTLIRLDSFSYGFIFALGMALVRAAFTHK